jgi:hypothetical protein
MQYSRVKCYNGIIICALAASVMTRNSTNAMKPHVSHDDRNTERIPHSQKLNSNSRLRQCKRRHFEVVTVGLDRVEHLEQDVNPSG